jgi:A/G-specific adenine glycosylase
MPPEPGPPAAAADPAPGRLAAAVMRWQRSHGRHDLPWQATRDPYRVWLSEVMLQQTQVGTVLGYYGRFLARFPDVATLAAAPLDEVLAQWSGLGYYRRARHLHRCARQVVQQHGGRFPRDSATLATLPGIGRSTAAAIAAFCHGERVAILDGNVKRVLSRALGFAGDLALAAQERALWDRAQALLPARGVAIYTQGLMDLGATLCLARAPQCTRCPLHDDCVARRQGDPLRYPVKTRRLQRGARSHALLWLTRPGDGGTAQVYLVQRPDTGVWAGLWSLPEFDPPEALQALAVHWPGRGRSLPAMVHRLTHFDWTLQPLHWSLPARLAGRRLAAVQQALPAGRWWPLDQALALGLPAPVRRLLEQG